MKYTPRQKSILIKHKMAIIMQVAEREAELAEEYHRIQYDFIAIQARKSLNDPSPEDLAEIANQADRVYKEITGKNT